MFTLDEIWHIFLEDVTSNVVLLFYFDIMFKVLTHF